MKPIVSYLSDNATSLADKVFIIERGGDSVHGGWVTVTYAQFFAYVRQIAFSLLADHRLRRGDRVAMRTQQSMHYLACYFGCHLAGLVAVPLEHDLPDASLHAVAATLEARVVDVEEVFAAATSRPLASEDSFHSLAVSVPSAAEVRLDDFSDILFTTGTTGQPKGVLRNHRSLLCIAHNLSESLGITREHIFIICGPLNHAGCWTKVFPVVLQGGTLLLLEGMKDLELFYESLSAFSSAEAARRIGWSSDTGQASKFGLFLVPSAIRLLMQLTGKRLSGYASVIDFIETGAAPISQSDMRRLCQLLPNSRLYNTYASSEAGVVATYNYNDGHQLTGCVGHPMPYSSVEIAADGTVVCGGDGLMSGYYNQPELTAQVLHDGKLFGNDLGYLDEEGRLMLTGRASDVINVGGLKVSPSEVEDVALSLPEVKDCICISQPHPLMGNALQLLVVLAEGATFDKRRIAQALRSRLEAYKVPLLYQQVTEIARTFNGKLDRKAYKKATQ